MRTSVAITIAVATATGTLTGCLPLPTALVEPTTVPSTTAPEPTATPTPVERSASAADEASYIAAIEQIIATHQGITVEEIRADPHYDSSMDTAVELGYAACEMTEDEFIDAAAEHNVPEESSLEVYEAARTYLCD